MAFLISRWDGQPPETVDFALPERIHRRAVRSYTHLCVIERIRSVNDADMFEIIEEDDCAKAPLLFFRHRREHHVELPRRCSLHKKSILIHEPPNEPRAIETLHSGRAPNIGTAKVLFDRRFHTLHEARGIRNGI